MFVSSYIHFPPPKREMEGLANLIYAVSGIILQPKVDFDKPLFLFLPFLQFCLAR